MSRPGKSTAAHDSSGREKIKCLPISSMRTFWTRWIRRLVLMLIVTKASHCQTLRRRSIIQVWQDDSHDTAFRLVGRQGGMWHTWPHHAAWSTVTTSGLHKVSVGSKPWELYRASQMLAQHWHALGTLQVPSSRTKWGSLKKKNDHDSPHLF